MADLILVNPRNSVHEKNIYDNEVFFQGYKALRQNDTGLNGALEMPAIQAQLPHLDGLHVLDIGCGFGDFTRLARSLGAATVTGVDVAARMISEARTLTDDPWIRHHQTAIEDFVPDEASFNLVVSSMALHYVSDYAQVIDRIYRALKPAGRNAAWPKDRMPRFDQRRGRRCCVNRFLVELPQAPDAAMPQPPSEDCPVQ